MSTPPDNYDPFKEFDGGSVSGNKQPAPGVPDFVNPFKQFDGKLIGAHKTDTTNDPFKPFGGQVVVTRDNTKKPDALIKPPSQKELDQDAQYNYYHPPIKSDYSSGNMAVDFIYNHPWLIQTPGVGNLIKEKAYQMALGSRASETLSPDEISKIQSGKVKTQYKGQSLLDADKSTANSVNLVDQYFGKISLPKSNFTPTSDYLPFLPSISIKGKWEKNNKNPDISKWLDYINQGALGFSDEQPWALEKDYTKRKPVYIQDGNDNEITTALGVNLNGHKLGIAYDPVRKLPYMSVSDAWDFSPKDYRLKNALLEGSGENVANRAYVESSLMQQAGQPFKVYDRFYFDPKTHKYIPDSQLPAVK